MKILLITSEIGSIGGGLSYSCEQFKKFLTCNIFCDVDIINSAQINSDVISHGGYSKEITQSLSFILYIKSIVAKFTLSDIVIAFGAGLNGYIASVISSYLNKPLIAMLRGSDINLSIGNAVNLTYNYVTLRKASNIVGLSQELIDNAWLISGGAKSRYAVIPNTISSFNDLKKRDLSESVNLCTGAYHLNEKKGITLLIKSIRILKNIDPFHDYHLYCVGSIDEDLKVEWNKTVQNEGVETNIHFVGNMIRKDFNEFMQTMDFYLQGSPVEGYSNSVADAISLGLPVILTNTGFFAENIKKIFPDLLIYELSPIMVAKKVAEITNFNNIDEKYNLLYKNIEELTSIDLVSKLWQAILCSDDTIKKQIDRDNLFSVVFHDIQGNLHDEITSPVSEFSKFVADVYAMGYNLCSLRDYVSKSNEEKLSSIVLTFDDSFEGVCINALPILNQHSASATVFVNTDYIGKENSWNYKDKRKRMHMTLEQLNYLHSCGWEIASHGKSHRSLLKLTDAELYDELSSSKELLEEYFGKVQVYAYPYGHYNDYIMKIAGNYYKYAMSLSTGGNSIVLDSLQIRRYFISEFNKLVNTKAT